MISTEVTPLLNKKGHAEIYIWISNVSQAIPVADVNSISSRPEFGHVALRLFDENGDGISYADNGYISLYPSEEKNENFIFKSPHQDFHSGPTKESPPNKIYKINKINFRAIQEEFEKIKSNNNIIYSGCFFNGNGKFNCAELILDLLVNQGGVSKILENRSLTSNIISVTKYRNYKITCTFLVSSSSFLACGICAIGIFWLIVKIIRMIIDTSIISLERFSHEDNDSDYIQDDTDNQQLLLEMLLIISALGFLVGGSFLCVYWANYTKNAIVITPDDVSDLLASVSLTHPEGVIRKLSSFAGSVEEKHIQTSRLDSQLFSSIQIDNPLSRSSHTLISSWNTSNQATNKQVEVNGAAKKEETKGLSLII